MMPKLMHLLPGPRQARIPHPQAAWFAQTVFKYRHDLDTTVLLDIHYCTQGRE